MTSSQLAEILAVLKHGRNRLLADFCNEAPSLYLPMFSLEASSEIMELAIAKYFFEWLNSHPALYDENCKENEDNNSMQHAPQLNDFIIVYRRLCERFLLDKSIDSKDKSHALDSMVEFSIQYLDQLLEMNEKSEERMRILRYQSSKAKFLFERNYKILQRAEKDGIP